MVKDLMPEGIIQQRPIVMLLRHAERDPFVFGSKEDPLLTRKGHEDAFKLGQELGILAPVRVYHSSITRCQQTAYELCRGISHQNGSCKIVGEIIDLGPALYVVDWDGILLSLQKHDSAFFRLWFDGKLNEGLIVPLERAAKRCLHLLINQLKGDEITTINISHDWNIMVILEHYFHLRHEDIGYPDFLSGIVAYQENQKLCLQYDKYRCILEVSLTK
jgi:broad specificity phosphatase PhoE